jgi:hypothetical protein
MSEGTAKIIDTKDFVQKLENTDQIEKIKTSKKLHKIAEAEIAKESSPFQDTNKNPFMNIKIPKRGFPKAPRGRKKPVIDFEKFTVNQYTYKEFSKSVNTVLPNVVNHVSFKDPKFLEKLKKSKDIKHFADEQILFPITNDYLGFASAVIGAGIEFYVENKMGINAEPSQPFKFQDLIGRVFPVKVFKPNDIDVTNPLPVDTNADNNSGQGHTRSDLDTQPVNTTK